MKEFNYQDFVFATADSACPTVDEVIEFLEKFRGKRFINGAAGEVAFYVDSENVICDTKSLVLECAGNISDDLYDQVEDCFNAIEVSNECPHGGDVTDDCADCAYAGDYHFVDGECVRRDS